MVSEEVVESPKKPQQPVFKNSNFHQHFRPISISGKKRTWRSLKQVLAQERSLPWSPEVVHYSCINAPPSFKPAKKYSDISGLPIDKVARNDVHGTCRTCRYVVSCPFVYLIYTFFESYNKKIRNYLMSRYTDPQTKLYYATTEEFATVRSLPMDITAGYLALRGASSIVG